MVVRSPRGSELRWWRRLPAVGLSLALHLAVFAFLVVLGPLGTDGGDDALRGYGGPQQIVTLHSGGEAEAAQPELAGSTREIDAGIPDPIDAATVRELTAPSEAADPEIPFAPTERSMTAAAVPAGAADPDPRSPSLLEQVFADPGVGARTIGRSAVPRRRPKAVVTGAEGSGGSAQPSSAPAIPEAGMGHGGLAGADGAARPAAGGVRERARPIRRLCRKPTFPDWLRGKNEKPRVLVRVTIGDDGVVKSAVVSESSGYAALDDEALRALRSWRFEPATVDAKPVESVAICPVTFMDPDAR